MLQPLQQVDVGGDHLRALEAALVGGSLERHAQTRLRVDQLLEVAALHPQELHVADGANAGGPRDPPQRADLAKEVSLDELVEEDDPLKRSMGNAPAV